MLLTYPPFYLHLLFVFHYIFLPLYAGPTSTSPDYPVATTHCFNQDSHPGIGFTNSNDCRAALRVLASEPEFRSRARFRFCKNPRNGHRIPKGWQHGQCVIYLSCENDYDAEYFSLAEIMGAAVKIIKKCVDEAELKWGGLEIVGDEGTFYVSAGRPHNSLVSSNFSGAVGVGAESPAGFLSDALGGPSSEDTGASSES